MSPTKTATKRRRVSKAFVDETLGMMVIQRLPGYFLLLALLITFSFFLYFIWPFITPIFLAAFFVIVFHPIHGRVSKFFGKWQRMASLLSCILFVLIIVVPTTLFVNLLISEAVDAYAAIQAKIESGVFDTYFVWSDGGFFFDIKEAIKPVVNIDDLDLKSDLINFIQGLSSFLIAQFVALLENFVVLLFSFFFMLLSMFYFFKDGKEIVKRFGIWSPLPSKHEKELFRKIVLMVKAIMFGVFLAAVVQGIAGGIGFAIAGIPNPIFWGTAMAFLSIVPIFGTALVWVPAGAILLFTGHFVAGIFLLLWGTLVIGSLDNILRSYFIGVKASTYPLLTFFIILGGIAAIGVKGVIVAPLVLMILMSLLYIYESEYRKVLKK